MKRLRDMEATTELQQKAQQLVKSIDPMPPSPARMARVRRRLDEPRGAGMFAALRKLPAFALAGLIALFGASAFAAVRVFVEVQAANATHAAQRAAREHATRVKPVESAAPAAQPEATPQLAVEHAAPQEPPELNQGEAEPVRQAPRVAQRHRNKAPAARTPEEEQAEAVHDSELVHRAVKALRREGDPALAARLLEEDRVRNPHGPLAEEALSLRIEAALALGDARAHKLAEQYLARYPSGRYLGIARRALGEETPK